MIDKHPGRRIVEGGIAPMKAWQAYLITLLACAAVYVCAWLA